MQRYDCAHATVLVPSFPGVPRAHQWVGFWDLNNEFDAVKGWNNMVHDQCPQGTDTSPCIAAKAAGLNVFFQVKDVLFHMGATDGLELRPDYEASFAAVAPTIEALAANDTVFGLFMGDELVWNGLDIDQLATAATLIKTRFPGLIVYLNMAYPPFTADVDTFGKVKNFTAMPPSIDWVSVDYYPDEGTMTNVTHLYTKLLYPKMQSHQRALYVPPSYGSMPQSANLTCGQMNCTKAMLEWTASTMDWVNSDSNIIGLVPWHWRSYAATAPGRFVYGARDMPAVRALWQQIGSQIVGNAAAQPARDA